jgi:hypothetical protein
MIRIRSSSDSSSARPLGTVRPQLLDGGAIVLYAASHGAPAWACGRYHECIASILRFPDVAANEWIAVTEFRQASWRSAGASCSTASAR